MVPSATFDRAKLFLNELFDRYLVQYNRARNCNGRLLDLCFINVPEMAVSRCLPFSFPEDLHHPALSITFRNWHDGPSLSLLSP